ncbi:HD domain-containing protein [Nocardioides sp. GXQ0305]|uniref:HD domain-containing protein n=1 Tax=Nocardioides sp. GXQ0305 TaxID=3423912 RepID=UPI003D7EF958
MDLAGRWPLETHLDVRDELLAAWAGPDRGYHDLRHLAEVLDRLTDLGSDDDVVRLAAWFHDGVHDGAADDEERSAVWAERVLPAGLGREVGRLVRTTERHRPDEGDERGRLLSDADLAILAAPPGRYAEYVADVRREYAAVPDDDFARGRAAVLADLLAKPSLFHTDTARRLWEDRARANVTAELARLEEG